MGVYEIRVQGRLDQHWATWFDGLTLTYEGDNTVLRGTLTDGAALHGVLTKVGNLNLHLLSVNAVETGTAASMTTMIPDPPAVGGGREPAPLGAAPGEPLADKSAQRARKRRDVPPRKRPPKRRLS